MIFRGCLWKLVYKDDHAHKKRKSTMTETSKRNSDNDVESLTMLKYGRYKNECYVFLSYKRHKLFLCILIIILGVPYKPNL